MPDASAVLTAFRRELVAAGVVRHPDTAPAGGLAPLFVEPADGAPAPGERDGNENDASLMVTATLSGELGEQNIDNHRRRVVVDVRYRSKGTAGLKRAQALDAVIQARVVRRPDLGFGWTMANGDPAAIFVLSSNLFAGLGRISASAAEGFDELAKYLFEVYA